MNRVLSKSKIQLIRSLQQKKARQETQNFIVQGEKSVIELLQSHYIIQLLICTQDFFQRNKILLQGKKIEIIFSSTQELAGLGTFESNQTALAVAQFKRQSLPSKLFGLTLAVYNISDPGNLGTLVRICDWFGIRNILASPHTTDFYNPKVIQSSMGSFCRVNVHYLSLESYLKNLPIPVYSTQKEGKSVHEFSFRKDCVVILGNESHGVSEELNQISKSSISIPSYGKAESLNVSAAAAILCDNYFRKISDSR